MTPVNFATDTSLPNIAKQWHNQISTVTARDSSSKRHNFLSLHVQTCMAQSNCFFLWNWHTCMYSNFKKKKKIIFDIKPSRLSSCSLIVLWLNAFLSIFQVAQIDMLQKMGLQPDGIVGHSVGELACGYADGSLSHSEAVLAAYWRGRCIKEANLPPGGMAAVG